MRFAVLIALATSIACATSGTTAGAPSAGAHSAHSAPKADAAPATPPAVLTTFDMPKLDGLTGLKGRMVNERVYRVDMIRPETPVTAENVKIISGFALPTWATFQHVDAQTTMVMGDIFLTEYQITPIMKKALELGFEVTALHNHFLWETPKVMFMHFAGMGNIDQLAGNVGTLFKELKVPVVTRPVRPVIDSGASKLNAEAIDAAIGYKGRDRNGTYLLAIDRPVKMGGHDVAPGMMMATLVLMAGTQEMAFATGDIAVYPQHMQAVIKACLDRGMDVVSIHNHMVDDEPRTMFVHYWVYGPAVEIATKLKEVFAKAPQ